MNFKIGHGYDVHKLVKGRRLILGGVEILHETGAEAAAGKLQKYFRSERIFKSHRKGSRSAAVDRGKISDLYTLDRKSVV